MVKTSNSYVMLEIFLFSNFSLFPLHFGFPKLVLKVLGII